MVDWADIYLGYSKFERIFYSRKKIFGKVYFFPKYTTYLKLEFNYKNYDYPLSINPNPDNISYDRVPSIEVELSHYLTPDYQISVYSEYFSPNFYWDPSIRANNYKIGGELSGRFLKIIKAKLFFSHLKDPDPATFIVNKKAGRVLNFKYKTEFLLGGGIGIEKNPFESRIKYIPNRDLDNSLDYSYFINFIYKINNRKLAIPIKIRFDYIYDKYSRWSYLSGRSSIVRMLTLQAEPFKYLGLRVGLKFLKKPGMSDYGFFIRLIYKSKL